MATIKEEKSDPKKGKTYEEVDLYKFCCPKEDLKDEITTNAEIMTIKEEEESDQEGKIFPLSEINWSINPVDNSSIVNSGVSECVVMSLYS